MREYKDISELTFTDDFMFCKVMSQEAIARQFLESLFDQKLSSLQLCGTQFSEDPGYKSHGVRFDVVFEGDNIVYDIEMQQCGSSSELRQRELVRRVRYYQACIDTGYLEKGIPYRSLPDSCIIFLCTFDPFGKKYAKYRQAPCLLETGKPVDDGTLAIYLNSQFEIPNTSAQVLLLLDYLRNGRTYPTSPGNLALMVDDAVNMVKANQTARREFMSLEEMLKEEREQGKSEARETIIQAIMKTQKCDRNAALRIIYGENQDASAASTKRAERMHL